MARELDGMLYQSLHLAAKGCPVIIGDRMVRMYVMGSNVPVCYLDSDQCEKINRHVLDNGGIVLNSNAEGLALLDSPALNVENYLKVSDYVTRLCMWGDKQTALIKQHLPPEKHHLIETTGYPSFDLLNERFLPFYKDDRIEAEFGNDYILINTSFGFYNHQMGHEKYLKMLCSMKEWGCYRDPAYQQFIRDTCDYQGRIILHVVELVSELARRYPDTRFVVRPHPAENKDFYRSRLTDRPNVTVTNNGPVRPWITSARAVIHHDCTTGMEAMLMGKPVIEYRPIFNAEVTARLMAAIGKQTESIDAVVEAFEHLDDVRRETREQSAYVRPFVANAAQNSAKTIADLVSRLDNGAENWRPEPLNLWGQIKCWRKYASKLLRAHQPGRNGRKVRYALDKFPRLPQATVQDKLDRLQALDPALPRVRVRQLCLNTFLISAAE